jgi:hypothetical protein
VAAARTGEIMTAWHLEKTRVRCWIIDENNNLVTRISGGRSQKEDEANAEKIMAAFTQLQQLSVWINLYQKCLKDGHEPVIMDVKGVKELRCGVCGWLICVIEECSYPEIVSH